MNLFLIIIQPTEPEDHYIDLEKTLQKKGNTCHQFGYAWFIRTPSEPKDVYNFLEGILPSTDQFIITPLTSGSYLCRSNNDCYHF